jgi:hypothetical protein
MSDWSKGDSSSGGSTNGKKEQGGKKVTAPSRAAGKKAVEKGKVVDSSSSSGSETELEEALKATIDVKQRARKLYRSKVWRRQQEALRKKRLKQKKKEKKEMEDSDYDEEREGEVGEEENLLFEEEDGDGEQSKALEPLNNDCMEMWKNSQGKVAISKFHYDVEKSIKRDNVEKILGSKGKQLKEEELDKVVVWFDLLKKHCSRFMKTRILEEIMKNAASDTLGLGLGWTRMRDLQDAWAIEDGLDKTAEAIYKVMSSGFFEKRKGLGALEWQEELSDEFMEKYDLVYLEEEKALKRKGCIEKQASRTRNDIAKNVNRKGKRTHGKIFTTRKVRSGEGKSIEGKREIKMIMVRETVKQESGVGGRKRREKGTKKIRKKGRMAAEVSDELFRDMACLEMLRLRY